MKHIATSDELLKPYNDWLATFEHAIGPHFVAVELHKHDLDALPFMHDDIFYRVQPIIDDRTHACVKLNIIEQHVIPTNYDKVAWQLTCKQFKTEQILVQESMQNKLDNIYDMQFNNALHKSWHSRHVEAQSFILKPCYPTNIELSSRKDKSDVQTVECFAFARLFDQAKVSNKKVKLIVDNANVGVPRVVGDVVCCSAYEAFKYNELMSDTYANCGTLFCVCSVFDKQSPLYETHKQLIESWTGNLVWLWWDLRLGPRLDGWHLQCCNHVVMTQAMNKEAALQMLSQQIGSYQGTRHQMIVNANLHALPCWYPDFYPNFCSQDTFDASEPMDAFSCPMVRWNDMGVYRQQLLTEVLLNSDIDVQTCGNLSGMPDNLQSQCAHHGTVKCSDIVDWNKQFKFALIVPEQFMLDCHSYMFRMTEAFLAGSIAVFIGKAPRPLATFVGLDDLHDLSKIEELYDLRFVKKLQTQFLEVLKMQALNAIQRLMNKFANAKS